MLSNDKDLHFWLDRLDNFPLTADRYPVSASGGQCILSIQKYESSRIRILAKNKPENIYKLFLASVSLVSAAFYDEETVLIHSPAISDTDNQKERTGKFFLHIQVDANTTVRTMLGKIHEQLQLVSVKTKYSLSELLTGMRRKGVKTERLLRIQASVKGFTSDVPDDDNCLLNAQLEPIGNSFRIRLSSRSKYGSATLQILANRLMRVLVSIAENLDQPVADLTKSHPGEINQVLQFAKGKEATATGTINELFENMAINFGNKMAMVYENTQYQYKDLDNESSKLAFYLLHVCQIRPGNVVAFMAEPDAYLCTILLGILKAGCVYMPVDSQLPEARLRYIINDSRCSILIASRYAVTDLDSVLIIQPEQWHECIPVYQKPKITPASPAYIIYTSGTTGTPKGVVIPHGALYNYVRWLYCDHGFSSEDRSVLLSSAAFDLGYTSLWGMLLNGGCIDIIPTAYFTNPVLLLDYIFSRKISIIKLTPSLFHILILSLDVADAKKIFIRKIFLGGEPANYDDIAFFHSRYKDVQFVNHYGPTESTVGVISCVINTSNLLNVIQPVIGTPIRGNSAFILNTNNEIQPFFTEGEICVGGNGLALGYLNNEVLTNEKFTRHPGVPAERFYHTGDKGRLLADGTIQFLGRNDRQVKINGYRTDLKEIDHAIMTLDGITASHTVLLKEDNLISSKLITFYTGSWQAEPEQIRQKLNCELPGYMIPGIYKAVPVFPVTANGKLDEAGLLTIYKENLKKETTAKKDISLLQQTLLTIWEKKLNHHIPGVNTNFFELGGHSLLAVSLFFEINKAFGTSLKLADIFLNPTIALQEKLIMISKDGCHLFQPAEPAADYPLSYGQLEIWSACQLRESVLAFNVPRTYRLIGNVNVTLLNKALQTLLNKHESLRTVFRQNSKGIPVQIIQSEEADEIPFLYEDVAALSEPDIMRKIQEYGDSVFDLENGPLMKVWMLRTAEEVYLLLILQHHIITDAWSAGILLSDWLEIYSLLQDGIPALTAPTQLQFKDYCCWQNKTLLENGMEESAKYWQGQFVSPPPAIELPFPVKTDRINGHSGSVVKIDISGATKQHIQHHASVNGTTEFVVLYAALNLFLYRCTGFQDILIGMPVSGRDHLDLQYITGYFVNILPLRLNIGREKDFLSFLKKAKTVFAEALKYQTYPYYRITEGKWKPTIYIDKIDSNPVIHVSRGNFEIIPVGNDTVYSKNELRVMVFDNNDVWFEFNESKYEKENIRFLGQMFSVFLSGLKLNPSGDVDTIPLYTQADFHRLTNTYNKSFAETCSDNRGLIHRLLDGRNQYGSKIALEHDSIRLTYDEMYEMASTLAFNLQHTYGLQKNEIVGLQLPRSHGQIIAILAVMMCGAVFLPIEYSHPPAYGKKLLAQAGAILLITTEEKKKESLLPFELISTELFFDMVQPELKCEVKVEAGDTAYIIYTSGSTGEPKGVEVLNRSFNNYINWAAEYYFNCQPPSLRVSYFTSLAFDLTLTCIFCTLLRGHTLVIFNDSDNIADLLYKVFDEKQGVDLVKMTPSHVSALLHTGILSTKVSQCILGGENVYSSHLRGLRLLNGSMHIYNEYGPTEATVGCTVELLESDVVTIGVPIANAYIYILNKQLHPMPEYIWGDLFIGGECLAKGYFKNEKATSDKFIIDPFISGKRIYRSGDIARWIPGGKIELKGRADNQVKSRGFRIEPAEIEQSLLTHPQVFSACVLINEREAIKETVAFIAPAQEINAVGINQFLAQRLPSYMIPDQIVLLDEFPLTANGKTDRAKLLLCIPSTALAAADDDGKNYNENSILTKLFQICSQLLSCDSITPSTNFFAAGGHSLSAIQLLLRVHQVFGVKLRLNTIFNNPELTSLAIEIEKGLAEKEERFESIPPVPLASVYASSHAQKRTWLLSRLPESSRSHHIQELMRLNVAVKPAYIEKAFQLLITKHEILRVGFLFNDGELYQKIHNPADIKVPFQIRKCDNDSFKIGKLIAGDREDLFDLEQPPMLRCCLIEAGEDVLLCITMHHIIADQWTGRILLQDMDNFIRSLINGEVPAGSEQLPVQYKDYAAWHNKLISNPHRNKFIQFWEKRLYLPLPQTDLPFDYPPLPVKSFSGKRHFFSLDIDQTASVHAAATQMGETVFTVLLSAFFIGLYQASPGSDFIVGIPLAGRMHPDTEEMVGLFLNALPCRIQFSADDNVRKLIQTIGSEVRAISDQQLYPIDLLVEDLSVPRPSNGKSPLFEHVFNWANANLVTNWASELMKPFFIPSVSHTSKHDFMISGIEQDGKMHFTAEFGDTVYRMETIRNFCNIYIDIVQKLTKTDQSITVSRLLGLEEVSGLESIPDKF
jgi:amino acid adenylation domain-containing protein